ncbi:ABC transporter ATP-binding protein [Jiella sp. MQZ9-1]|uniref:ABC transporter ATP-binding protein n=1 Tax=Jiella flava TaxID=2816857 RepID=A0A939FV15_9HYPH|nr:ABC transporter ATP-binding protein [Jiella flava]MBO0662468.1 ABC transporter ATP-binding protein [Jiella flava]MCD2471693.1 ABC transporter ATP-binding protein [Jiella flava]
MTLTAANLVRRANGRPLVDGVSLTAEPGECLAIVGPNGSGKTTLISMFAGLRLPHAGRVTLNGTPLHRLDRRSVARQIALVEQHAETGERLSVREVVDLGRIPHLGPLSPRGARDEAVVDRALVAVGMADMAGRSWHSLSGGERQRAHIARALAQEPQILILDEPTNHLDIEHQLAILALVTALDATIIVALHDLNHAAMFADRVAVMERGRLVAIGRPADVLTAERISAVFKVQATIEPTETGRGFIRFTAPSRPATWG